MRWDELLQGKPRGYMDIRAAYTYRTRVSETPPDCSRMIISPGFGIRICSELGQSDQLCRANEDVQSEISHEI